MTANCEKCGFPLVDGHKCPTEGVGMRHNAGKARTDLIPAIVLMELGKHYEYGARKYAPNNWVAGFPYSDTYASLTRHLFAWWAGERNDPENGHHHLVAVIWNAITLFYFELFPQKYISFDDRPITLHPSVAQATMNARSEARGVPYAYNSDATPMDKKEWEKLYMGTFDPPIPPIPPTVPIPEGYAMVRDGMALMEGDEWMNDRREWVPIKTMDYGSIYSADRMMRPVIRPYGPSQLESIKIQIRNTVGDPCSWCEAKPGQQHRDHCTRGEK